MAAFYTEQHFREMGWLPPCDVLALREQIDQLRNNGTVIGGKSAQFAAVALRDWIEQKAEEWKDLDEPPDNWDFNDLWVIDLVAMALDKIANPADHNTRKEIKMAKASSITRDCTLSKEIAIEIAGPLKVKLTPELHAKLEAAMLEELTTWPLATLEVLDDRPQVVLGLNLSDSMKATVDLEELLDEFAEHYSEQAISDPAIRECLARAVDNLRQCADRLELACQPVADGE